MPSSCVGLCNPFIIPGTRDEITYEQRMLQLTAVLSCTGVSLWRQQLAHDRCRHDRS